MRVLLLPFPRYLSSSAIQAETLFTVQRRDRDEEGSLRVSLSLSLSLSRASERASERAREAAKAAAPTRSHWPRRFVRPAARLLFLLLVFPPSFT